MFSDEQLDVVSVESNWRKDRYIRESSAQTKELPIAEVAVQTVRRKIKETQTEDEVEEQIEISDDFSEEFQHFIIKTGAAMVNELQKNASSTIFSGYDPFLLSENQSVQKTHTLSHAEFSNFYQVTGLAWNSTGALITASFGHTEHDGWCTHKGCVCAWNVDRLESNQTKPICSIDVASCVTCITAHPVKPAIFAGGTASGEVIVWTTGEEEETLLATSGLGEDSHKEPVSDVHFVQDPESRSKKFLVISVGTDGHILMWQIKDRKQQLKLIKGFALLAESLPREIRMKAKSSSQEVGANCLSFNPQDSSIFVLGGESGGVFKCSVNSKGTIAKDHLSSTIPLHSPVTLAFSMHDGPVFGVSFSPFQRNLILTCSADTTFRIYSLLQVEPIQSVAPSQGYLYASQWSPVRPAVFVIATEEGNLLIYDLCQSRTKPVGQVDINSDRKGIKKANIRALKFNHKDARLIATGDSQGHIHLFQLSDALVAANPKEKELLETLDQSTFTDERL